MEKYITFTIDENMAGETVGKILRTDLKLTQKQISQAKFRPGGIQKNGIQCRVTNIVQNGDQLSVCIESQNSSSEHIVPFYDNVQALEILYEDEDLLAVNKPAGILTHPSGGHYADTLSNQVAAYFNKKKVSARVRPVGRLDKDTSGIVLFAKNRVSAQRLQAQRETGLMHKQYLAVVRGNLSADTQNTDFRTWHTVRFPIRKVADHPLYMEAIASQSILSSQKCTVNTIAASETEGLLPAVTHYQILYSSPEYSIITLRLDTGRTHQIRVHMKALGHPLLGDTLYQEIELTDASSSLPVFGRTALHAWKTVFRQPFKNTLISLEAPLPDDFHTFFQNRNFIL